MNREEIRIKAEQFCRDNGISEYPVSIVNVCNNLGLKVFEQYMDTGISGLLVVDQKYWEKYNANQFIVVNLIEPADRRRFTIAHELAHYVLHKKDNTIYAHRDINDGIKKKSQIESEADYFASNILMPEVLVRERASHIEGEAGGSVPFFIMIQEIADSFLVSKAAAEVRLKQLNLI